MILASVVMLTQCKPGFQGEWILEEEFRDPGKENRPLALWCWLNGYVDTTNLIFELEEMKDKGMRGALIWDVGSLMDPHQMIPAGPAMLSEKSRKYFSIALQQGKKLDLDIGWFASSSWNAGGPWVEPENASMELISSSLVVEGPSKQRIEIKKPQRTYGGLGRYSLISSMAIPFSEKKLIDYSVEQGILLDEYTSEDGFIEWEVPGGKWEIISFFMANTDQELECPSPNSSGLVIDHLSRIATKNNFDSILTRLATVSSPEHLLKFFMLDSYEVWPMTDWSPLLIQEFRERYGYDPLPYLPLLRGYKSKDTILDDRFRGDYSRLVSDMMIENHFAQSVEIADEHGFEMITEAGHGGFPRVDPLKALGNSHIPMGEFWNRKRFWVTKEAASAAHIYGKELVASESLTGWNHWQHGPTDFKQLIDIAFCEGLNQVVFHTFSHNPEIAGKPGFVYHAGEHVNVNATWWELARPFMDYIGRCSYMLRQGNFVGDALLYYGDQAPNLVPPKRIDPNITPIFTDEQCLHCGKPKPVHVGELPGYDYDYINADIITSRLYAEDGKLLLPGGLSYRVMLLPDRVDISLEVLQSLEKLVSEGAVIIGPKPERTNSLENYPECDRELKVLADSMWGACDGEKIFSNTYGKGRICWGVTVRQVLEELQIPPDFEVRGIENGDWHIDHIHRRTETEDIYFVSNSSQGREEFNGVFRVDKKRIPEIWDAETGLIQREVEYAIVENGIAMDFTMDPLSSRFIVFRDKSAGMNDEELNYDLQFGFRALQKEEMSLERIDLSEDWEVGFDPAMGAPQSYTLERLDSWTNLDREGIRYYSGKARYSKDFVLKEESVSGNAEAYVVFEEVQEMARVLVNGHDCGIVWLPPHKARVSPFLKAGTNTINVEVINTWNNRIVGDLRLPAKGPYARTNAKARFTEDSPLLESGLLGRAELLIYQIPGDE